MLMTAAVVSNIGRGDQCKAGQAVSTCSRCGCISLTHRADFLNLKERLAVMVSASIRWTIDRSLMQMESQE
jgi:hypothetical protein